MNETRCVFCGEIIPEGRQVCPACERLTDKIQISAETIRTGIMKSEDGSRWIDLNTDPTVIYPITIRTKADMIKAAEAAEFLLSYINEHAVSSARLVTPDGEILWSDWGYAADGLETLRDYWREKS